MLVGHFCRGTEKRTTIKKLNAGAIRATESGADKLRGPHLLLALCSRERSIIDIEQFLSMNFIAPR